MASQGSAAFGMVNPAIFEHLQTKIDEDIEVREGLKTGLQVLEKQGKLIGLPILALSLTFIRKSNSIHTLTSPFHPFNQP